MGNQVKWFYDYNQTNSTISNDYTKGRILQKRMISGIISSCKQSREPYP